MRIRSLNNELDPHEFNGLVYNLAAEQIPIHLAKTARESGHVLVWADQAFCNHDHQLIDDDDARTEEPLMVAEIADVLRTRFPHKRFVIELDPVSRVTWYQQIGGAPTNDDSTWTTRKTLLCHKCGESATGSQPYDDSEHRGIRNADCASCGWRLIHSTRVIRYIV